MDVFDGFLKNVAGDVSSGLSLGGSLGSAVSGVVGSQLSKGVQKDQAAVRTAISGINSKRIARENRYLQGLASVQNAAGGDSQYGSYLALVAADARVASERIEDQRLQVSLSNDAEASSIPTLGSSSIDFVTQAASAIATRAARSAGED